MPGGPPRFFLQSSKSKNSRMSFIFPLAGSEVRKKELKFAGSSYQSDRQWLTSGVKTKNFLFIWDQGFSTGGTLGNFCSLGCHSGNAPAWK